MSRKAREEGEGVLTFLLLISGLGAAEKAEKTAKKAAEKREQAAQRHSVGRRSAGVRDAG